MSDGSPRRRFPRWAIVACVVVLVAGAVTIEVRRLLWSMNASQYHTTCRNNLSQLAQIQLGRATEKPLDARRFGGPAMWIEFRKNGVDVKPGDERVFACPADGDVDLPESAADRRRWDDVDLDHVPRDLCSYAGRDFVHFPIPADAHHAPEPIGACVQHRTGAIVAYDDGNVRFVEFAELGVESEGEMIVGPESKSPVLRVLRYGDGSVR